MRDEQIELETLEETAAWREGTIRVATLAALATVMADPITHLSKLRQSRPSIRSFILSENQGSVKLTGVSRRLSRGGVGSNIHAILDRWAGLGGL